MDLVEHYQRRLLEQTQYLYYETPISEATQYAFLHMPRHRFIQRYRDWGTTEWHNVGADNVGDHLATLYANQALPLFGNDDNHIPSTISQPSLVLRMLDLLQLEPGHTVFELGAGSGWNAALMGELVGPTGHVYSLEIIPEMAQRARETIAALGIKNVHILAADGSEGYAGGAPYDRVIFTAGTYDLPCPFYTQMKQGGLFLAVMKNAGGGDHVFLLRKTADHFASLASMPCGFVQLTGQSQLSSLEPIPVETLPEWHTLQKQELSKTPFWWGGKGKEGFVRRTHGIRSFLGITEPSFRAFKTAKTEERSREEHYFGLWDQAQRSLVLAKDDWLIAYGSAVAQERLWQKVRQWVDLGMPSAASFALQVYPRDVPLSVGAQQWLVIRSSSQFLWSLTI
jgi:protein-L-isoaspartate(D-aspartate) O-methyltransferase